jgi:hypothetical protein
MAIASSATGGHGGRIDTRPLVIVEFILDTLPSAGTPAEVIYTFLKAYWASEPEGLKHLRVRFSIGDNLDAHTKRMTSIVKTLKESVFAASQKLRFG